MGVVDDMEAAVWELHKLRMAKDEELARFERGSAHWSYLYGFADGLAAAIDRIEDVYMRDGERIGGLE